MTLTDDDIEAFIREWKAEFCESLPQDVARGEATRLVEFFTALRKIPPPSDSTRGQARDTMPA